MCWRTLRHSSMWYFSKRTKRCHSNTFQTAPSEGGIFITLSRLLSCFSFVTSLWCLLCPQTSRQERPVCVSSSSYPVLTDPSWAMFKDIRSNITMLAQHLPITSSHRLSWWYFWIEISSSWKFHLVYLRECSNIPAGELDNNIVDSIPLVVLTVRIHLSED